MPRGGKRENAGRKVGSVTTKTRQIADRAAEEGILPLDVMLDNMRFYHQAGTVALDRLLAGSATPAEVIQEHSAHAPDPDRPAPSNVDAFKIILELRGLAGEAAKDAAPYLHPRIATVEGGARDAETVPLAERLKAYAHRDMPDPTRKVVALPARK